VTERLRHAATEGRLAPHELEERLAVALRARTYRELRSVVADLPVPARPRKLAPVIVIYAVAAVAVFTLVAIAIAALVFFSALWLFWAVMAWAFFGRRRLMWAPRPPQLRGPVRSHWM
jgi:hypothetical protein